MKPRQGRGSGGFLAADLGLCVDEREGGRRMLEVAVGFARLNNERTEKTKENATGWWCHNGYCGGVKGRKWGRGR